jgi:hypothetical protein
MVVAVDYLCGQLPFGKHPPRTTAPDVNPPICLYFPSRTHT